MTSPDPVTPLTRFARRVPTVPARTTQARTTQARTTQARTTQARTAPVRTAAPAATADATAVPAEIAPAATVAAMVICLPGGLPAQALTTAALDRHFGVTGTLHPRFWAKPDMWLWQRSHLIDLRKGRPAACAGGPVKLLDLTGMRHAAGLGAGIRHQVWQQVVHGTRPAHAWHVFQTRHLTDPVKYPLARAEADFVNQPRVNAMRLHNAAGYGATHLPTGEVEMFQAGPVAYQHYTAATAVCADALLIADGHELAPASDALAHRVTYLELAGRHLDTVDPAQRLLAITL
ncbi:hypothetical protein AB0M20_25575 [Actinoplanes sp. NPDC051633]|uniref:hypothetical protein n=1 Tax=Actinoplanes sp. NPDC051633 TaxID=3155670 RepID=UPI003417A1E6